MNEKPSDDDDREIDPQEIETASDETPTDVTAPELDERTKQIIAWDDPPSASGSAAPKVLPDDEASVDEKLVYEGTDQADRDRRLAAADPDFEP